MASFLIKYAGSAIPIERTTLTDATTTIDNLHSTIDKSVGSTFTKNFGTAATEVKYKAYLTTTSAVALSHSTIFNGAGGTTFLLIKIVSAGSSGTPDVQITFDSTNYPIGLSGVGDFCIVPMVADNQDLSNIKILSSGATTVANVEIMVGM